METQKEEEPRVCVACLGVLQEFCDVAQATKVRVDDAEGSGRAMKMALSGLLSAGGCSREGAAVRV